MIGVGSRTLFRSSSFILCRSGITLICWLYIIRLSAYRIIRFSVTHSMPAGAYHLLAVAVDILMALSLRYIDKYEWIVRVSLTLCLVSLLMSGMDNTRHFYSLTWYLILSD